MVEKFSSHSWPKGPKKFRPIPKNFGHGAMAAQKYHDPNVNQTNSHRESALDAEDMSQPYALLITPCVLKL